ncbi:hypothetical protein J6590_077404 [Homalodisca vitripennis]|nr:hypothetical protein J6590_077404 [Homalodisca vitripennis]
MAYSLRILVVLVLAMLAVVSCMPMPDPSGWGGKHEHYVIHVPYHVHHVHHYHKVPVYIKEHHYSKGWDWD